MDIMPLPKIKGFSVESLFIPSNELSGDFYHLFKIDATHYGILLVDVVGKGIYASRYSGVVKTHVNRIFSKYTTPEPAIKKLNIALITDPLFDKHLPFFYGILNTSTSRLTYINAGLGSTLYINKEVLQILDPDSDMLGFDYNAAWCEHAITLDENDSLTMYTDGITDARNNNKEKFGLDRFKDIIYSNQTAPLYALLKRVKEAILNYIGTADQYDDITIVSIKKRMSAQPDSYQTLLTYDTSSSLDHIRALRYDLFSFAKHHQMNDVDINDIVFSINEIQLSCPIETTHTITIKKQDMVLYVDIKSSLFPSLDSEGERFIKDKMDTFYGRPQQNKIELVKGLTP